MKNFVIEKLCRIILPSVLLSLIGTEGGFVSSAHAQTINDAVQTINNSLNNGDDPFDPPAEGGVCPNNTLQISGYKAFCQMDEPNNLYMMIGCVSSENCANDGGQLAGEHQIMVDLNIANVPSAQVSGQLINGMTCEDEQNPGECAAFVEQHLHGHEMTIAQWVDNALDENHVTQQQCAQHTEAFFETMENLVMNSNDFAPVRALEEQQKEQFSLSFQQLSDFATQNGNYGIGDLQGFLQNQNGGNGAFIVFDPDERLVDQPHRNCFVRYTAAIAELIEPIMENRHAE